MECKEEVVCVLLNGDIVGKGKRRGGRKGKGKGADGGRGGEGRGRNGAYRDDAPNQNPKYATD